jgi:hypothetical protein
MGVEQFKGDTIRIRFESFMIEVQSPDLIKQALKQSEIEGKAAKISNWLNAVSISEPMFDELIYILISDGDSKEKRNYQNITFEHRKKTSKKMVFSKGEILEKDFGNYIIEFNSPDFTIKYFLTDLSDLGKISKGEINSQLLAAEKLIPEGRKKINGWLILNENEDFESHFLDESAPLTLDMLSLNIGVGAGIVKNQWVNDISLKVGFGFMNKGLQRNAYYAEFKMVYDFLNASSDKLFSINSFVTAGWEHNYSRNIDKEKWFGVSLGYLVDRNTDFFEKNTWKFAVHKRINQTISVSPELYFNDFFKNVYPGIQIGISF